jgi:2-methylcitrate dehydratase PrpD
MTARHRGKGAPAYTEELIGYIKGLSYGKLPEDVVRQAKLVVLDTIGVLLAASSPHYRASAVVQQLVQGFGGSAEATVAGTTLKTSAVHAALANGTMADNIELDDSHPLSGAHVAAVVVPTALALAEKEGATGKSLLTSVVVGYDVDVRVVLAMTPSSMYDRGFHPSAVGGAFGATAVAGKLLDLSKDELRSALGLAGSQASGLMAWENDPTQMPKSLQMGIAARNGVTAATLAGKGFSGPPAILEGHYGAVRAFSDEPRLEELSADLGTRFEITLTGLKKYACCRFLHASLDAFLEIVSERDLGPDDIEEIVIRVPVAGAPIIDNNDLLSHNAQYIMPLAARDRAITPEHIFKDHPADPEVARLARHVSVVGDEELSRVFPGRFSEPAVVEVATSDGHRFTVRSDFASGDPEKPLTQEEVDSKFRRLATTVIPPRQAEEIMKRIHGLDQLTDSRELTDLLSL